MPNPAHDTYALDRGFEICELATMNGLAVHVPHWLSQAYGGVVGAKRRRISSQS